MVTSFNFSLKIISNSDSHKGTSEWKIEGGNVIKADGYDNLTYYTEGESICSDIYFLDYSSSSISYTDSEFYKSWDYSLNSYSCNENSYIEIYFWKE